MIYAGDDPTIRNTIRFNTNVKIETCDAVFDQSGDSYQPHQMSDISLDGLSFYTNRPYRTGKLISIKIEIPNPAFKAKAAVIWCNRYKAAFKVGVKFIQIDSGYRIKTVERLI